MTSTGARRRPQKYPDELRERAVRMVLEIREETGEKHGTITRVAKELGVGAEFAPDTDRVSVLPAHYLLYVGGRAVLTAVAE